ncbi:MAG TPA: ribbon-helix-helix protein, CopG family [Pyrodictium sp.]|nr:ribbon-helix-helix protein, CopG family [Pyrodictium sp.]
MRIVCIRLEEEVLEKLDKYLRRIRKTRSEFIRDLIKKHILEN